jgi:hypothetical protein
MYTLQEVARVLEQRELKAGGLAQEITTLRAMLRARERVIFGFKRDVASLAHHISAPKDLEAAVTGLYKKFVQGDELTGASAGATASGAGGAGRSSSKGASKSGKAAKSGTATSTAGACGTAAAANNDAASAASSDSEDEDRLRAARRQRSTTANGGTADAAGARRSGSGNNANTNSSSSSGSGSGGQQAGGSELQEQALEAHRQREFMEKRQSELRAKLAGAARTAAKRDRAKLGENAVLIAECNALRKENIALRRAGDALRQVLKETRHGGATTVSSAAGAGDTAGVGSTLGGQSKRKLQASTSDSPNGSSDPLDDSMQWREDTGGGSSAGGNRLQVTNGRPQAIAASSGTDSYDRSGSATAAASAATAAAGAELLRESSSASALLLPSRSGSRRGLAHTPGASELAMSPTGVRSLYPNVRTQSLR